METGKYGSKNGGIGQQYSFRKQGNGLKQRNLPDNVFAQREEVFVKDSLPVREEIVGGVRQLEHSQAPVGLSDLRFWPNL